MIEIRIHGRGGQGVKKAGDVIARAGYLAGFKTQDFALYGAERQGAPLTSFVRMDEKPIKVVGYIETPEYVLVLDESIGMKHPLKGVHSNTKVLINSPETKKQKNFFRIDATDIALKETGRAIPNIALLGAFAKLCPEISMNNIEKAVRLEFEGKPKELIAKNLRAAKKCFRLMK